MSILIWIGIAAAIVGLGIVSAWLMNGDHDGVGTAGMTATVLLAMVWIVFAGASFLAYVESVSTYGELRGVRDSFVSVERSIEMTKSAFYTISEKALFDTPNFKQSSNVSEAIVAARNIILEYNRTLQSYRTRRENSITRIFCAPVPADLKPLVWSEK